MRSFRILLLIILFLSPFAAFTQNRAWDRPMQLKRCSIQVKANLFTATTYIEMEFYNPNSTEIEGLHRFRLHPGQAISHFQLDLNGKFRDGSIEEKWKAANAYNTIVGKRIDPALLQMDDYNQYSLRIYPVPAKGSRRISFTITQLLSARKGELVYELPLQISDTVETFRAEVLVGGNDRPPYAPKGLLQQLPFSNTRAGYELQKQASAIVLNKPLVFHIPLSGEPAICTKEENGIISFAARVRPQFKSGYRFSPRMVRVYWDISASAAISRDLDKERSFLQQYLAYHGVKEVEIVPFGFKAGKGVRFASTDPQWESYLRRLEYDGGTQIGAVDLSGRGADAILIFSDGWNSYGNSIPTGAGAYVFCIYSGAGANHQGLKAIAEPSGGRLIDLHRSPVSQGVRLAGEASSSITGIRFRSGRSLIDQTYQDGEDLLITGTLESAADTLEISYGNSLHAGGVLKMPLNDTRGCTGASFDKLSVWQRFDAVVRLGSWQDRLLFGKTNRVVTQSTSYLVLERVEDYVRFNIEPPAELTDECEAVNYQYVDNTRQRLESLSQQGGQSHAQSVIREYNRRIGLWGGQPVAVQDLAREWKPLAYQVKGKVENEAFSRDLAGAAPGLQVSSEMSEVVVMGYATARRKNFTGSVAYITSRELMAATTIEQALEGRVPGVSVMGQPGAGSSIRIRGASTLAGDNQPLFVLDGMPVSGELGSVISVSEINHIQVLKDASAAALYGSRGANGVILITSKKGKTTGTTVPSGPYKLKDMEEVDYLKEIREVGYTSKLQRYRELQKEHGEQPGFYLDMAEHFFASGLHQEAKMVLTNASEKRPGNLPVLRAMGFILEQYKEWEEAQLVWQQVLQLNPVDALAMMHLAQARAAQGDCADAVRQLYEGAFRPGAGADAGASSLLLTEMGTLITGCSSKVDTAVVPPSLVRPMPVDLRIVVEFNDPLVYDHLQIKEPGGTTVNAWTGNKQKSLVLLGGGNRLQEYSIRQAKEGIYKIRLTINHYNSMGSPAPRVARLTIYRNYGKPNMSVHTETIMLDNQYGDVEIAEARWGS